MDMECGGLTPLLTARLDAPPRPGLCPQLFHLAEDDRLAELDLRFEGLG